MLTALLLAMAPVPLAAADGEAQAPTAAAAPPPAAAPSTPVAITVVAEGDLILGDRQDVDLEVVLPGEGSEEVPPPPLAASAGHLEPVRRVGPRAFQVRYVFPREIFPHAVLIAAGEPDGGARGFTVLRLCARARPGFRTEPGAAVTVRVGHRDFGPQRAGKDGQIRVEVVVPPGVSTAVARSRNAAGESTEQSFDLAPPPFPRLLVLAPTAIAAGELGAVAVLALDQEGAPAESEAIALRTSSGRPRPLGGVRGESRFLVTAPTSVATGPLKLAAGLLGEPGYEIERTIPVVAGPASVLRLESEHASLAVGSGGSTRVFLRATDQHGNDADHRGLGVFVDGRPTETQPLEDGRVVAVVHAPARLPAKRYLEIEAVLDGAYGRTALVLTTEPTLPPSTSPTPRVALIAHVGLLFGRGRAPGPALALDALARLHRAPAPLAIGVSLGYARSAFSAEDRLGRTIVTVEQMPLLALIRWGLHFQRRIELSVAMGVGAALTRAQIDSYPWNVSGLTVAPALQLAGEVAVELPRGAALVGARHLLVHPGRLSTGDTVPGNSAGPIFDAGYRLGF